MRREPCRSADARDTVTDVLNWARETRPIARVSAASILVAALVWSVLGGGEAHATTGLTVTWLFFAGSVAGALAVSAVLELCGAEWAQPLQSVVPQLSRSLPIAAGLLVVLAAMVPEMRGLHGAAAVFFFVREVVCGFALFAFGRFTVRDMPGQGRPAWVLVSYCVLFAAVVSVWAFDFIVAPSPGLANTLAGPHLFVGAFTSGLAFMAIGALARGTLTRGQRRDTALLIVALAICWAYLSWSQLLTFWYGNLPDEVAFLSRRSDGGWGVVSGLVVLAMLAVPFAVLLGEHAKHSARLLCVAAASQLVGLWLERELLIAPALPIRWTIGGALLGGLTQCGVAAVFVAYVWPRNQQFTSQTRARSGLHR